jgi:hypothetical protein
MNHRCRVLLSIAISLSAIPARAQSSHVDVLFYDVAGRVVTGATDFGPPFRLLPDVRIFPVTLDDGDIVNAPGFTANATPLDGSALPGEVAVTFDVVPVEPLADRNLSHWDGAGAVTFQATPNGERVEIDQKGCFSCAFVTIDGSAASVTGFSVGTTTSDGSLHKHHDFRVFPGPGATELAPPGFYLIALRSSVSGLLESEPYYVLLGKQVSGEQRLAAVTWIETHLIPEPAPGGAASAALLALAGIAALRRFKGR